jgi:hypothetical protein
MMRPIPRIEIGAADSMSIAAMLVYILDISGETALRVSARICRRRKHIIKVTMTFRLTLSETHGTMTRIGLPLGKDGV